MARRSRRLDMARRRMRDMRARRMNRRYDMGYTGGYADSEYTRKYGDSTYPKSERTIGRMGYKSDREYDRHYEYPYYMNDYNYDMARSRRTGRYIKDRMDYGYDEDYLSDEELMEWSKDLLEEIEPQFKSQFEMNKVIQRAKEMGVKFKDYTEDEYYVTALMMATDYGKTVGMNNIDQIFRMAVDWLEDDDVEVQGSEKLLVYYDEIVCPE